MTNYSQPDLNNFVGGKWKKTKEHIPNLCPIDGSMINWIPCSNKEETAEAISFAKESFNSWSASSIQERADLLEEIAAEIEKSIDNFSWLESIDTGKPLTRSKNIEIPRAIENFRFFAREIRQNQGVFHHSGSAINYTHRMPVGVAALITPWNLPLYLLSWKVAPALAMGNSIVAKPSELTPLTADALAKVFEKIGAPEGIFNLIHGLGAVTGQSLVSHDDVKIVSFTGGTLSGKKVAETAAGNFKKLSLELGGKNPSIVFADADFDKALEGIFRAAFSNQGQICLCGSRILIEESVYEKYRDALVKKCGEMKIGNPFSPETDTGTLISSSHLEKVEGYVELAKKEGGQILCGGEKADLGIKYSKGCFFKPTLIDGLGQDSRVVKEEIFGPVATLQPFKEEDEVMNMANDSQYGLAASIWTKDLNRAHRMGQKIESGMVWINTWMMRDLRVPFGGMKNSGVGREGGNYSLDFYSEVRNICVAMD